MAAGWPACRLNRGVPLCGQACFAGPCACIPGWRWCLTAFTPLLLTTLPPLPLTPPLQAPTSAVGFRVCVHKWLVLVRLLLGEVPDRTEFTAPDMAGPLAPYFDLTQAVRSGDLTAFRWAGKQHRLVGPAAGVGPGPRLGLGLARAGAADRCAARHTLTHKNYSPPARAH